MSRTWARSAVMGLAALGLAGCRNAGSPRPPGPHLVEKGPYQALYDADGHLLRVLHDRDGDGRAELVASYGANGRLLRAEVDTDGDGIVDRWEYFGPGGVLYAVGVARCRPGQPDEWWYPPDTSGASRVERDEDGDGRVDHWMERRADEVLVDAFDTDGDGRPDQQRAGGGSSITREGCPAVAEAAPRR